MSSDFYFRKWREILAELKHVVNMDVHYQETEIKDKTLCKATERLSGMLGQYTAVYNEVWDCLHHNLQVQKTRYIHDVMGALVSRILELKFELRKLEVSECNFNSSSLANHKLTFHDADPNEIPEPFERPDNIKTIIIEAFERVKEKIKLLEEEAAKKDLPEEEPVINWWDTEENVEENAKEEDTESIKKIEMTEEQIQIKQMVEMIQAQERSRQTLTQVILAYNKKVKWEKELLGILPPPAPYAIREKSAKFIQKVYRAYFESKRQKYLQYKRDERLGLMVCLKPEFVNKENLEKIKVSRRETRRKYDEKLKTEHENFKKDFAMRKGDDIREHYRDEIREWFKTWYESIKYFHDLPDEKQNDVGLIFKEELPTPEEWLEEYKTYMKQKKSNKNKTNTKFAKLEAKREEMDRRREEQIKIKLEKVLRRKMMKNPTMHPGYIYPKSTKMDHVVEAIGNYHRDWDDLDTTGELNVKKEFVRDKLINEACMEVKIEMLSTVEEHMKQELKLLRNALRIDYANNDEEMLEPMRRPKHKKGKKKQSVKKDISAIIPDKLENLIFRGIVKEYTSITLNQFKGDPNFAGDDKRCDVALALPANGEVKNIWWHRSREMVRGFRKILLVGASGSGKTTLVHVLASMNDAVLFELDATTLPENLLVGVFLDQLIKSVATCAKFVQPSVIHIKHVHKLFYRKVPPKDAQLDWKQINRYIVKKLLKNIQKTDKVTIIGTCTDPWMSNKMLLKQFPNVQLMPDTSYGTLSGILKDWVVSHTVIPPDFNISNLAYVLRGYSYGYIKYALEKFLTGDTVVRIAARGLSPMDVYDFIVQDNPDGKVDYEKYLSWYADKTTWGAKEMTHHKEQLEFKQACAVYAERLQKKKQKSAPSTPPQSHGSHENLA